MSNPNPRHDNLVLGRGKKPKLGHQSYKINLSPDDKEKLDQIAEAYDCLYAGKGSISGLLTKIANDTLSVVPSAPYSFSEKELQKRLDQELQKRLDQELQKRLDQELQKRLDQELQKRLDQNLQKGLKEDSSLSMPPTVSNGKQ